MAADMSQGYRGTTALVQTESPTLDWAKNEYMKTGIILGDVATDQTGSRMVAMAKVTQYMTILRKSFAGIEAANNTSDALHGEKSAWLVPSLLWDRRRQISTDKPTNAPDTKKSKESITNYRGHDVIRTRTTFHQ